MIYLIIPCYNEESRLNLEDFCSYEDITYVFANDGSTDNTSDLLKKFVNDKSHAMLYDSSKNYGKANIIQRAYIHLTENQNLTRQDWVGYWDADLATPLSEVHQMLSYSKLYSSVDAIWGSRVSRLGSNIHRSALRHYLGRIFATIISMVLKVKSYDSQCGAKLFNYESSKIAFSEEFITQWIFDVEILLKIKEFKVVEYPLIEWRDIPGSKVNVFKDIF